MPEKIKMLNSQQILSETNSEHYHCRFNRKSMKMIVCNREQESLSTAKEMLNHPLTYGQGRNKNQLSRTTNNRRRSGSSSSSYSCSKTTKTWLSGLGALKSKHKHQQQQMEELEKADYWQHQPQHQLGKSQPRLQHCQRQLHRQWSWLLFGSLLIAAVFIEHSVPLAKADQNTEANTAAAAEFTGYGNDTIITTMLPPTITLHPTDASLAAVPLLAAMNGTTTNTGDWLRHNSSRYAKKKFKTKFNPDDSIFLRFAKRFTDDNNLVSGIIQDCYHKPTFACFQKNVYVYLNEVLDAQDVNVTQRLKFYRNENAYMEQAETELEDDEEEEETTTTTKEPPTETTKAYAAMDSAEEQENEIPRKGRSFEALAPETPIEEVTNALYGKSIKFAMTHNIELKLPEMMFDGATFRISPKSIEGNGVIAKLELIPKQNNEARLAGKFLMKKIQKILKSKLLLSFLALVLIIKIIKIKLFWLLPLVIGVGAAKKLLLKFLLFLFPALSHLFKLCSYYQQTYHSTKYHHHHHHINHHHTVVPPWHGAETAHIPEVIYSHPPKGHVSAYLHGAPIHENYGPPSSHEHFDGAWENSGPGLGSEYISDINRVAQIDDKANYFKPHSNNDANEIHAWGLGTTPISTQNKRPLAGPPPHNRLSTPLQKPPISNQTPQNYQKPQATSQTFNPFKTQGDKQSFYNNRFRNNVPSQSAPSPVYKPLRQPALQQLQQQQLKPQIQEALTAAGQIVAQYDPGRNQQQQQHQQQQLLQGNEQLTPELSAQIKEALRIQAEQRLVQNQQQILEQQPFAHDGKPLMPLNYDPFYSPILLKIDKIIEQLGIGDEACKERVVCSMYKDPERYSPHSNFVSAELSRDVNELQPITSTNPTVVRFFRLIQAARDGQDHKNCLALYPDCSINTE